MTHHVLDVLAETLPWLTCRDRDVAGMWRVAVRADGRRSAHHATIDDLGQQTLARDIVLDHAGPAASRHALERAVALVGAPADPVSGRRARALLPLEVDALVTTWAAAAGAVRASGRRVVVAVDDDGLLHRALSPPRGPTDVDAVVRIIAACAPCDLRLTIEDLAPGGLDATAGLAFARRALAVARASRVYAGGGTAAFDPLWSRRKGRSVDTSGLGLASAVWLAGCVDVPVFGVVRGEVDIDVVTRRAGGLGLAGVLHIMTGFETETEHVPA